MGLDITDHMKFIADFKFKISRFWMHVWSSLLLLLPVIVLIPFVKLILEANFTLS